MSLANPSNESLNANQLEKLLGVDWGWIKAHADHMPHSLAGGGFKVWADDLPVWQELARAAHTAPPPTPRKKPALDANELVRQVRATTAEATKKLRHIPQTPEERRAEMDAVKRRHADIAAKVEAGRNRRVQVISEGHVYRRDGQHSFLRDVQAFAGRRDKDAYARLQRNNEEYRAYQMQAAGVNQLATTGGEFVPPMWLISEAAPVLRAGRPFLNALGVKVLPSLTNQLDFPKITTGASVAVQTDAGSTSNTDLVTTSVTAQIQTAAGRTVASYAAIDLSPAADQQWLGDLVYALNSQLDLAALTANVTNAKGVLNQTGINAVTYTSASPTGAGYSVPVSQAAAQVGKFAAPSFAVMNPATWFFISGSSDTTNARPLYLSVGAGDNMVGTAPNSDSSPMEPGGSASLVGNIGGIPICIDPNVPTNLGGGSNEGRIIVLNRAGFDFWASPPFLRVDDQTRSTTLENVLTAYAYFAMCSRQPKLVSVVSGTGLVPQTGWN